MITRMPILVATAALTLAAATAVLAESNTFTDHFTPLDNELAGRLEGLSGELDKSEKKRLKGINKARSAMEKESTSLEGDLKAAKKVFKSLRKPFADGIADSEGVGEELDNLEDDLRDEVWEVIEDAGGDVEGPETKAEDKASNLTDKAGDLLDDSEDADDFGKAVKLIGKALKQARKARKILDKDSGKGGDAGYTASINSTAFDSPNATAEYTISNGELQVFGTMPGDFFTITLWFSIEGVSQPGTYNFTAENSNGAYNNGTTNFPLLPGSGSVTVTTLDLQGSPRVAGTFTFQTGNESITIDITQGSFNLTEVDVRSGDK